MDVKNYKLTVDPNATAAIPTCNPATDIGSVEVTVTVDGKDDLTTPAALVVSGVSSGESPCGNATVVAVAGPPATRQAVFTCERKFGMEDVTFTLMKDGELGGGLEGWGIDGGTGFRAGLCIPVNNIPTYPQPPRRLRLRLHPDNRSHL